MGPAEAIEAAGHSGHLEGSCLYLTCFHSSNEHSFYSSTREIWWSLSWGKSQGAISVLPPSIRASRRRRKIWASCFIFVKHILCCCCTSKRLMTFCEFYNMTSPPAACEELYFIPTGSWLQMNRMSLRNNQFKFKFPGKLPTGLKEFARIFFIFLIGKPKGVNVWTGLCWKQ